MSRKPAKAVGPSKVALADFVARGATSAAFASQSPPEIGQNLLNRLYSRGWIAKASDGRWWVTDAGMAAIAPEAELQDAEQEA